MKPLIKKHQNTECSISYVVSCKAWVVDSRVIRQVKIFEKWFQKANPIEARNLALKFGCQLPELINIDPRFFALDENMGDSNAKEENYTRCKTLAIEVEAFDEKTGRYTVISGVGIYEDVPLTYKDVMIQEYFLYKRNGYTHEQLVNINESRDTEQPIIEIPAKGKYVESI